MVLNYLCIGLKYDKDKLIKIFLMNKISVDVRNTIHFIFNKLIFTIYKFLFVLLHLDFFIYINKIFAL